MRSFHPIALHGHGDTVVVRQIVEERLLHEVYRLRYDVYVNEMGKPYPHADHAGRTLEDTADRSSIVLGALHEGALVGTARCIIANRAIGPLAPHGGLMVERWREVVDPRHLLVCSRLVVDPRFRKASRAPSALVEAMYVVARELKVSVGLCSAREGLVRFFERYGFRRYGEPFLDEDAGLVQVPLALMCEDVQLLNAIRSPFRRYAARYANHPPDAAWRAMLFSPVDPARTEDVA